MRGPRPAMPWSERGYRFIIALGPNGLKMDRSWAGGCACNADKCCKGLTETRGTSTRKAIEMAIRLHFDPIKHGYDDLEAKAPRNEVK